VAIFSNGLPLLLLAVHGEELELLGVAVLIHQWCHTGDFPSLSVSDGKERLLMAQS
jgi:hypothetical protein